MSEIRFEYELFQPVRRWLMALGYTVYAEIMDCDVVGQRGSELVAVELKLCLSKDLHAQLEERARWFDFVYACVPTQPINTVAYVYDGFGVLLLKNGKIKQKHMARPQPWRRVKRRALIGKKLEHRAPSTDADMAGLPRGGIRQRSACSAPLHPVADAAQYLPQQMAGQRKWKLC